MEAAKELFFFVPSSTPQHSACIMPEGEMTATVAFVATGTLASLALISL